MAWEQMELLGQLHATEDKQPVRDRVFALLGSCGFRIDASIFTKANTYGRIQSDPDYFYKLAWFFHFKKVAPYIANPGDELLVVGTAFGTRKQQALLHLAIRDVVAPLAPQHQVRTAYWMSASDPCLVIADYCCWAIQRKWEQNDPRSYVLIKDKIAIEEVYFQRKRPDVVKKK